LGGIARRASLTYFTTPLHVTVVFLFHHLVFLFHHLVFCQLAFVFIFDRLNPNHRVVICRPFACVVKGLHSTAVAP
jgi:hypothetical protein